MHLIMFARSYCWEGLEKVGVLLTSAVGSNSGDELEFPDIFQLKFTLVIIVNANIQFCCGRQTSVTM